MFKMENDSEFNRIDGAFEIEYYENISLTVCAKCFDRSATQSEPMSND